MLSWFSASSRGGTSDLEYIMLLIAKYIMLSITYTVALGDSFMLSIAYTGRYFLFYFYPWEDKDYFQFWETASLLGNHVVAVVHSRETENILLSITFN